MKAIIFDTETTSKEADTEIIETAWLGVKTPRGLELDGSFEQLFPAKNRRDT